MDRVPPATFGTVAAATLRDLHRGAGGRLTRAVDAGENLQVCTVERGEGVIEVPALPDHLLEITLTGRSAGVAAVGGHTTSMVLDDAPGGVSFLPAGHAVRVIAKGRVTSLQLLIGRGMMTRVGARALADPLREPALIPFLSLHDPELERQACRLAALAYLATRPGNESGAASPERLCVALIEGCTLDALGPSHHPRRLWGPRFVALIERIDATISDEPSAEALAQAIGWPPERFEAAFEVETEQPLDAYLAQRRIDLACRWLDGMAANEPLDAAALGELAARVGFVDGPAFIAEFVAQRGHSPERYRSARLNDAT